MNPRSFRAGDLETYKALPFEGRPGQLAPTIVCGSMAEMREERDDLGNLVLVPRGKLLPNKREALHWFEGVVCDEEEILTGVNIVYDLACAAAADEELLPFIFQAIRQGRVYDAPIVQSLDAIFGGHLGLDPRTGQKLRDPLTNKEKKRYSLEILTQLVLGRDDAKDNDAWRTSYALLEGIPAERWPWEAVQYPIDDAENTLGITIAQAVTGWKRGIIDPETGPARNLGNMAFQVRAAFALHLGACRGLRTDRARVEALDAKVEAQHAEAVKRYQGKGWIRPEGTEDQASVKRSVALAYGAVGKCATCGGTGKKPVPCRGEKIRGRFAGCVGKLCPVCGGTEKLPGSSNCRIQIDEEGKYLDGCDGTGLDLQSAPMLPRTDKQGVSTDRDTLMESGDDDLSDYGENEFEKTRSTYLPWLKRGIDAAVTLRPNVLVATGRCSYEDPLHQMPRGGGVRECIVARPGWVFSSTDYEAGELCCLAQFCYWVLGHSAMRDAINENKKPGILHSVAAAEVLGIPLDEFLKRLKAKDKQAVDFRQAMKPINFGKPGSMGIATLVLTSRKKNAGSTTYPDGRTVAGIRFCVLVGGASECGLEKITEWKKRPTTPVCKACCDVVDNVLSPAYFARFPEIKEYFTWVSNVLDDNEGRVPCLVWNADKGEPDIVRWRGGVDFSAACNNGFQAMLGDVGKLAFADMIEEAYTGCKPDGSPSPLAGDRPIVFMHDEPLCELKEATAHLAGPRIAEIMMAAGKHFAPDVTWVAETAIARYLSKGMEPVYRDGKLVLWEPKQKEAA